MNWSTLALSALFLPFLQINAQASAKLSRTEVVVIADLSNRIDKKLHPGQLDRDTTIIGLISEEFGGVVRRSRYLFSRDRLRLVYVGGQNSPMEPRVDVAKMNEDHRVVVKELPQEMAAFKTMATKPYLVPRTSYEGADLWSWFRNTAPKILQVKDPHRRVQTRIIILTDGYLEFAPSIRREAGTAMMMAPLRGRPDWETRYPQYRLKPSGGALSETKVLILELAPLNPARNTTEQEIIERYWTDWFKGMGVEASFLSNSEALPTVRDAIKQFLAR